MRNYTTWSQLSPEHQSKIIELSGLGLDVEVVAGMFNVRSSSLERRLRLLRSTSELESRPVGRTRLIDVDSQKRIMFYGDLHAPRSDDDAVEAVILFAEVFDPEIVVNLGDTVDASALSRFGQDTESPSIEQELNVWYSFAEDLNSVTNQEGCERYIVRGNHDGRIARSLPPSLKGLYGVSLDSLLRTESLGYQPIADMLEFHSNGSPILYATHGQFASSTAGMASRKMSQRLAHSSVVVGHNHKTAYTVIRTPRGYVHCYEVGCLQRLDPDWDIYPDWTHSILAGYIGPNGVYLSPVPIENDSFFWNGNHYRT